MTQQNQQQGAQDSAPVSSAFIPGHIMTREHYERLAREAAGQK